MTKREWQIEMANRFAKSDRANNRFPNYESICIKCGVTIYKPSKELTDAQNIIRDLKAKLECYERLADASEMASNPMGAKSREALRNVREMRTIMTKEEEEIRKAVESEREACAKVADKHANGLERNYSEIIADLIRARGKE